MLGASWAHAIRTVHEELVLVYRDMHAVEEGLSREYGGEFDCTMAELKISIMTPDGEVASAVLPHLEQGANALASLLDQDDARQSLAEPKSARTPDIHIDGQLVPFADPEVAADERDAAGHAANRFFKEALGRRKAMWTVDGIH